MEVQSFTTSLTCTLGMLCAACVGGVVLGGAQLPRVMSKLKVWAKMLAAAAAEGSGRARSEDNFLSEWRMRLSVGLLPGSCSHR